MGKKLSTTWIMRFALCLMMMCPQMMWAITGSGSSSNPYQITSAADWATFRETVNSSTNKIYAKLMNDITLTGNYTPVGTSSNPFLGELDGNNKTITIDRSIQYQYCDAFGLFAYIDGAYIHDLKIDGSTADSKISAQSMYAGTLVGVAKNSSSYTTVITKIYNVQSSVDMMLGAASGYKFYGGIVGDVDGVGLAEIKGCTYSGKITANSNINTGSFGGVVGNVEMKSQASIAYCLFSGEIETELTSTASPYKPTIGGILGSVLNPGVYNPTTKKTKYTQYFNGLSNCFSCGTITSSIASYKEGIIGSAAQMTVTTTNTVNNYYLSGKGASTAINAEESDVVASTNAAITVTVASSDESYGSVSQSYVNPVWNAANSTGTATQLQVSATPADHYHFVSWSDGGEQTHTKSLTADISITASFAIDTHTISVVAENGTFTCTVGGQTVDLSQPLAYGTELTLAATPNKGFHFHNWTKEDGTIVSTDASFQYSVQGNATLTANFQEHSKPTDPAAYDDNGFGSCTVCGEETGQPLGSKNSNGYYEINNAGQLYSYAEMVSNSDQFFNAKLMNDIVVNKGSFDKDGKWSEEGDPRVWKPLVSKATTNDGKNYVYHSWFTGQGYTISGLYFNDEETNFVGFLEYNTGYVKNLSIINSYFKGKNYVGTICGQNTNAYKGIENCHASGFIEGNYAVGGISGGNKGNILNCSSSCDVKGSENIGAGGTGGICGTNVSSGGAQGKSAFISNCYSSGNIRGYKAGGIAGRNWGADITNSYSMANVVCDGTTAYTGGISGHNQKVFSFTSSTTNCYTNNTLPLVGANDDGSTADGETNVSAERFASGEICYLLNGSTSTGTLAWGQNLETQPYPVPTGEGVHYARTMANQWGTIVLPFDVEISSVTDPEADGYQPYDFYELSGVSGTELTLTKKASGTLTAGTPVIIRRSGSAAGVDIKHASTPAFTSTLSIGSSANGLTLTGTYSKKVLTEEKGYIINNDAFWSLEYLHSTYPDSEISIGAFRAYLAGSLSSGAAQLRISAEEATALEILNSLSTGEALEVFDLNGRRLDDLREGVNIIKKGNKSVKIVIK